MRGDQGYARHTLEWSDFQKQEETRNLKPPYRSPVKTQWLHNFALLALDLETSLWVSGLLAAETKK